MKAVLQDAYGPPEVLRLGEAAKPEVGAHDVLVRVRAASVNPPDWAGLTGVPYVARSHFGLRRPRCRVRGSDLAGVVEAVGANVTRFAVGDAVFGGVRQRTGTFAEYAVAGEEWLAPKPAALPFEQAAALPMAGLVALQALRDVGHVGPGQKVLITGAGGGIGTFAVQIARWLGARVTGVCGTGKVDLVRALGADRVIDYAAEDFTRRAERYDLVLDNVLAHPLRRLVGVLEHRGTLIANGGQFWKRWTASTGVIFVEAPALSLVVPQSIRHVTLRRSPDDLLTLAGLVASGRLTPVIGETYPLGRTAEALARFGEGHARGKIVITVP